MGDYIVGHPVDFEHFPAAGASRNDAYAPFGNAQMLCDEFDQGTIGGILHCGCRHADLDHSIVDTRKLRLGGARLSVDLEANGELTSRAS